MGKKKKKVIVVDEDALNPEDLLNPEDPEEVEREDLLDDFAGKFAGRDYKIRIEKFMDDDNDFAWCGSVRAEGFEPYSQIKKRYGGGKYRITLLDEHGKYVKGGQRKIHIVEEIVAEAVAERKTSPFEDPGVMLLMKQMESSRKETIEMFKVMAVGKPAQEPMTPMQMIEMISKVSGMNKSAPMDPMKLIEMMVALKGVTDNGDTKGGGVLGELTEAMEVANKMGFLKPRQGSARVDSPVASPMRLPSGTQPSTGGQPQVVSTRSAEDLPIESPNRNTLKDVIFGYIPMFERWAKTEYPIQDASDFLLASLENEIVPILIKDYGVSEDQAWENLVAQASAPEEVGKIFLFFQNLAPYENWVRNVIHQAVEDHRASNAPEEVEDDVITDGVHTPEVVETPETPKTEAPANGVS